MINALKRLTIAGALTAAAALAIPATATAAPALAAVTIETVGTTTSVSIATPESTISLQCVGPWVHTEAAAAAVRNDPTLDVANHPENWFTGTPVSPANPEAYEEGDFVHVYPGDTRTAIINDLPDGKYVAGVLCAGPNSSNDGLAFSLSETPFTIGDPVTQPEPGGTGSLSFGS
ncbi:MULTISPECIES: hypothetical protein [Rhodococcus]|uniref:hypothetical protein n=1 Tax=Rhodococcus TaxID=1827 RepID=UPI0007AE3D06|nr:MULTISPECIES: hypothetical protein [Rhodococcus]KZL33189.1 hypothetical protein A3852_12900 [Rhodococcus qingshengii]MCE4161654.1 hypothetical protein [Rhodococcus sp. Ni2]